MDEWESGVDQDTGQRRLFGLDEWTSVVVFVIIPTFVGIALMLLVFLAHVL